MALAATLAKARPVGWADGRLTIAVGSPFALTQANRPESADVVADAVEHTRGGRPQVACELARGARAAAAAPTNAVPGGTYAADGATAAAGDTAAGEAPAGESPAPAGDAPAGDAPAGDVHAPANDAAAPTGDAPAPAGDVPAPANDAAAPTEDAPAPASMTFAEKIKLVEQQLNARILSDEP